MRKKIIFPFIRQAGFTECGTTCLAIIFKYYGYYDIRGFLSDYAQVDTEGTDLYTLSELAENFGFETEGLQISFQHLREIHLPAIAHYEGNHFVVVYKATADKVWLSDPAVGKYTLERKEFEARWNGIVLVLKPGAEIFKHDEITALATQRKEKEKGLFRKFYLSSFTSSREFLFRVLLATLLLQMLGLAIPLFTQTIIDQVLVNENKKLLYAILIGMGVVFTCQLVLTYARNILLVQFKVTFERNFFSKYFDHFIRLKQLYFDRHKREDFINRFQENLKIRQAMNPSILEAVVDVLFVGTYLTVLFFYHHWLGFLALVFVLLYLGLTALFTPRLKRLENYIFAENVKTMGQFLDTLLNMQTVRLLGIEKLKFWKWKNQYTKALNKVLQTEKTYTGLSTLLSGTFYAGQAVIYWAGAYLTFKDELSIGEYIAFITIFTIVINSLTKISQLWFIFTELSVTFDKLNDVLMQEPSDSSLEDKSGIVSPVSIRVQNLSFKYKNQGDAYILKDISLSIAPGTFVGIVGRNGSGKSTLVKLLCKLYDHYEGKIYLNQTELRNIIPAQLRKKIAVIPQEVALFDGTIRENILYGNPGASNEQMIEAAKMADLHDYVVGQFLGYNLRVGESGSNLSGGQKLKIAFARLFISSPEIIILDEASSALDVETERKIMKSIKSYFSDKIIISIAHRLHTLREADHIVVLDQGKITEEGDHASLLEKHGLYNEFVNTYINF
jgi:ABC-type bacteriocin/lantibiotic exporter with double-glycine peptidase domain